MFPAFEKQPQEKKDLIIKVAIEEFVKNGYEKASTDVITNRAGISKGILFHYFKSKKKLYLYMVDYVTEFLTEKTLAALKHVKSDDFFERIKEIYLLKQQAMAPYMTESQLMIDAFTNPPVAVKKEIEERLKKHYETYGEDYMFKHFFPKELIQTEKLRDDISLADVTNMIMLIMNQLSTKYQNLQKKKQFDYFANPTPVIKELDAYLKIVKYGIYKF